MSPWPFLNFFSFFVYSYLAVLVVVKNPRAAINRVSSLLLLCFALWAFGKLFIQTPFGSKEDAYFFERIVCLGSFSFSAVFLWFALLFSRKDKILQNRFLYPVLFAIPTVLIYQQWTNRALVEYIKSPYGWGLLWTNSFWTALFFIYYPLFAAAAVYLVFDFARKTTNSIRRKQARIIVVTSLIGIPLGSVVNILLPKLGFHSLPDLAQVVGLIWALGLGYSVAKYKFLVITPAAVADNIISTMTDSLILLDDKTRVVNINLAAEQLLGFSQQELKGSSLALLFPETQSGTTCLQKLLRGEQARESDFPVKTKQGKTIYVDFLTSILREEEQDIAGTVCIMHDVSERKKTQALLRRAKENLEKRVEERTSELRLTNKQLLREIVEREEVEDELKGSQEQLDILFEHAPAAYFLSNLKGEFVDGNKGAAQLTGYQRRELVGNTFFSLEMLAPKQGPKITSLLARSASGTPTGPDEFLLRRKDENKLIVEINTFPVRIKGQTLVLGCARDVTEQRRIEQELQKTERLESLALLAGGIAHDFNNILTVILTNIDLAKMYVKGGDNLSERLGEAQEAALQARNLTQQLLTFSKGGVPVKKAASISDLLRDVSTFTLRGSNVRCEFNIASSLWAVEVDKGQISQVIQNLVINAQQAMPEGGVISVSANNVQLGPDDKIPLEPGEHVQIVIKDQGVGIPQEYLQKIFNPYFTTKQKGSGLGLAVVFSIIKKHNGHINVEATPGAGTTFYIYLPACHQEIVEEEEGASKEIVFGKGRILVMDDEEALTRSLSLLLRTLGYETDFTTTGQEALELYKKTKQEGNKFDALILDLTVPGGKGGKEVVEELIKIDPQVKAIASSGYSNDPVIVNFQEYGFKGSVGKPYEMQELSQVLRKVLNPGKEET